MRIRNNIIFPVIIMAIMGVMSPVFCEETGWKTSKVVFNGAFIGDSPSETLIQRYETKTGTKLDSVLFFHAAAKGFEFPSYTCKIISDSGAVPFIKYEPWSWRGKDDESFSLEDINRGDFDEGFRIFARGAAEYGKPVLFSFAHEMNSNYTSRWYPWQGSPIMYCNAYRRVHGIFEKEGAFNVKWVWVINANTAPPEPYFPGRRYADWIGIDGYSANWNGNPADPYVLFGRQRQMLKDAFPDIPIMIAEVGYDGNNGGSESGKKEFISKLPVFCTEKGMPFYYFDIDKVETGLQRRWGLKDGYYEVLGDSVNKCSVACSAEPSAALPDKIAAESGRTEAFSEYISLYGVFNGAHGRLADSKGATSIDLVFSGNTDPGMAVNIKQGIKGKLLLKCSGGVTGGFRDGKLTVLFIRTMFKGDAVLGEADIDPAADGTYSFELPKNTDKINFMVVGPNAEGRIKISEMKVRI